MESESVNEEVFKEYKELEPKRRSLEHYIVIFLHLVAAVIISVTQLSNGIIDWVVGYGIVTPVLLIINGVAYSAIENDSWYREEMVPFISRIISTSEIETDRFCQYHRRPARSILILGLLSILVCQWVWTFGLTVIMPFFAGDDAFIGLLGEFIVYGLLLGPFALYFFLLLITAGVMDLITKSRYKDIAHLIEIEDKWVKEYNRRAKVSESVEDETPSENPE